MTKISKKNKFIFCMGEFNVSLLNYNTYNYTNEFMNNMISDYVLPHTPHPTRVTDNIFQANNTIFESVIGNIITHISDHFPQFIILNKTNIDYKRFFQT